MDTEDTCGGFTNSTPTCFPAADGGKCYKTVEKQFVSSDKAGLVDKMMINSSDGDKVTVHGCDADGVSSPSFCAGHEDHCRREKHTTVCCCAGDL